MKAIETSSLGGCYVQIGVGREDRMGFHNLHIQGSINKTIPG